MIDEINRGNLSRIFGELLMLIEADKRSIEWAVRIAYARRDEEEEERIHVPPNLYLIGTMNTADRSLALVDYALRRFAPWTAVGRSKRGWLFTREKGIGVSALFCFQRVIYSRSRFYYLFCTT